MQNDCELLNICSTNHELLNTIYDGFVFDKLKRNDGLFQYMVYLKEIKMTNRITSRHDLINYGFHKFKIYIFHDQERLKHKVRLEFQHSEDIQIYTLFKFDSLLNLENPNKTNIINNEKIKNFYFKFYH